MRNIRASRPSLDQDAQKRTQRPTSRQRCGLFTSVDTVGRDASVGEGSLASGHPHVHIRQCASSHTTHAKVVNSCLNSCLKVPSLSGVWQLTLWLASHQLASDAPFYVMREA